MTRAGRRWLAPLLVVLAVAAAAATPASAAPRHVEPEVQEAPAAGRFTFSFVVEHGCGSSPTTGVAIQVPEGSFDLVPRPPEGWSGEVADDGTTVAFEGGPLDAATPETFSFELVTPDLPGETVLFPTVQTCVDGSIAWIDPDPTGEEPAPRVLLTENPDPVRPTTTLAPTTTAPPPDASTTTSLDLAPTGSDDDPTADDDGNGALVLGLVAALLVAGAAGFVAYRRRS